MLKSIVAKEIVFCTITDKYIDFLRTTEPKEDNVLFNKSFSTNDSRKYIGVLLDFGDYKYFAPLSSPKEKHKYMNNKTPDVYKIADGLLGIINLNNMIPVVNSEYKEFNFNTVSNPKYKALLINQYIEIKENTEQIIQKAKVLRTIYIQGNPTASPPIEKLIARCCNFPSLEKKANAFSKRGSK